MPNPTRPPLVEAISRDFNDQLIHILSSHRPPYTPYETFDCLVSQTANVFRTLDNLIKEFTNVATREGSDEEEAGDVFFY